jgi:hypothetical protein
VTTALLTSGVVYHYADGPARADQLTTTIRRLEDQLLAKIAEAGPPTPLQ